jgi:hypothetical protein
MSSILSSVSYLELHVIRRRMLTFRARHSSKPRGIRQYVAELTGRRLTVTMFPQASSQPRNPPLFASSAYADSFATHHQSDRKTPHGKLVRARPADPLVQPGAFVRNDEHIRTPGAEQHLAISMTAASEPESRGNDTQRMAFNPYIIQIIQIPLSLTMTTMTTTTMFRSLSRLRSLAALTGLSTGAGADYLLIGHNADRGRPRLARRSCAERFDLLVIGSSATGADVALDAVTHRLAVAFV